jgi:hypothetical protein
MQTGQGLVLGMGFGLRKGSEVITSIQKRISGWHQIDRKSF